MSQQFVPNNPLPQGAKVPEEVAVFSPEVEAEIDRHLSKYPVMRSAILPLMFIVQRERGGPTSRSASASASPTSGRSPPSTR